jgi:hypothetical protein
VDGDVIPTYEVKAWQEDGWWLARVVAASDGADTAPLNALTQARTLTKIEDMARDLIATILDVDEGSFETNVEYVLPDDIMDDLQQARGARGWLETAQRIWNERAAAAARALSEGGYSLRETAKLLGLSHQRVDQLLSTEVATESGSWLAVDLVPDLWGDEPPAFGEEFLGDVRLVMIVHARDRLLACEEAMRGFRQEVTELLSDRASHFADCARRRSSVMAGNHPQR